jgi:hypothetical protein
MDETVEKMARALQACAETFRRPVSLYVEGEARDRYEETHGIKACLDALWAGRDFNLESWAILAQAAIAALSPDDEQEPQQSFPSETGEGRLPGHPSHPSCRPSLDVAYRDRPSGASDAASPDPALDPDRGTDCR